MKTLATELRIGNFINENAEIIAIAKGTVYVKSVKKHNITSYRYKQLKSIPITEQWLVDFGFGLHKYPSPSRGKTLYFKIDNEIFWIEVYFPRNTKVNITTSLNDKYIRHLKYVHQLQNLYFALTDEELIKK